MATTVKIILYVCLSFMFLASAEGQTQSTSSPSERSTVNQSGTTGVTQSTGTTPLSGHTDNNGTPTTGPPSSSHTSAGSMESQTTGVSSQQPTGSPHSSGTEVTEVHQTTAKGGSSSSLFRSCSQILVLVPAVLIYIV
ncbi:mucin-2-like [Sphaeramia orbicularis]|uniref:mucin-2-like n=1 Tax=Sphaeramia orbicularis TaxID=375764 RepID=UPI00117D032F|nr:mucin-2-like [Sphaeramia orbicularis]